MRIFKTYKNGLRLIADKIDYVNSVTIGVFVKTGSMNETEIENGISHFIEHCVFKGTKKRTAFEISDFTDSIGAQINAFTSKEATCFYTKSTTEHLKKCADILSDILFDATFLSEEIEKEKGVIIEEINMSEDSPEDLLMDLLSKSRYGDEGLGRTILGSVKNVRSFTYDEVKRYMDKYYTADNIVISVCGNFDEKEIESIIEDNFASRLKVSESAPQFQTKNIYYGNVNKYKKIEQAHIGLALNGIPRSDKRGEILSIANTVLGGGMSSRLFQKVREELGLAYTVYSALSQYKDTGTVEIYAGVNTQSRDIALEAILDEIQSFRKNKITEQEFLRGKEQLKSSIVFSRESPASQMLIYGKFMLFLNEVFDFDKKYREIEKITYGDVVDCIDSVMCSDIAVASLGPHKKPLKI